MTDLYPVLHYRGDLTKHTETGRLLGSDGFGLPYAIIDAEYEFDTDRTRVYLQRATPDQVREATTEYADRYRSASDTARIRSIYGGAR